jgi:hypothetical protein
MSPTNLSPKIANKFVCEYCNYNCSKKSDYDKHLSTNKHKILQNPIQNIVDKSEIQCVCGKKYKHSSTLYAHKKKCTGSNKKPNILLSTSEKENIEIYDLVKYLMHENTELKNMMMDQQNTMMEQQNKMMEQQNMVLEIAKNGTTNNSHNTTNTNSHNKAFNLQFFLNETCKDAMNITDFVESIQYQLSDLEKMGEIGYVDGISNIIVKNLNALDVTQRPVHCTDKKRETIYIKDEDKWEKDEEKNKIRKVIKKVAFKNARLIQKFKEKHPDYNEYHSKYSTQYNKLIIESFGGSGDNDLEKEDKIIRNIAKNTVVDK